MKSIFTLILIFPISLLQAQTNPATPNANFESWTHNSSGYDNPDSWNTLNSSTSILGFYTCYKDSTPADVRSGKYSVELVTMEYSLLSELVPGTITTGTINTTSQTISGGLPYTLKPDSIVGWYKYTPVSGDNADIEFYLFGSGSTDTIGEAFFKTPTTKVGTYTRFSYPVTYRSSSTPVTALWILTSSLNQKAAKVGSVLIADSLGLIFNTSGINNITNPEIITVGPNPSRGIVSINNNSTAKSLIFILFDVTGRKIDEEKIIQGQNYLELTGVPESVYIYSITPDPNTGDRSEQNKVIKTGKIVFQK
ncbi:MAG: PCMD domain-containing protein [Bacteroidia bacterium]